MPHEMQNDALKISLDRAGRLSVHDKRAQAIWTSKNTLTVNYFDVNKSRLMALSLEDSKEFAATLGSADDSNNRQSIRYEHKGLGLSFRIEYTLHNNYLGIKIPLAAIRENAKRYPLMSITPLPGWGAVRTGEKGYMFLPTCCGTICHFDKKKSEVLRNLMYGCWHVRRPNDASMPVFGMVHNNAAFAGIITSGEFDAELIAEVNQAPAKSNSVYVCLHYRYEKNDEIDQIDRSMRYYFLEGPDAGYVGMAKTYRTYLLTEKKIVPLKQRVAKNKVLKYYCQAYNDIRLCLGVKRSKGPGVPGNGRGAFLVKASFQNAQEIVTAVKESGIDKACFALVGWTHAGHDGAYPTKLPPDKRLGGEQGLRALIRHAKALGYQISGHDNYTDSYKISPDWDRADIQKNRDGSLVTPKWYWSGGLAYKLCPEKAIDFAKRNLPRFRKLGFRGVWLCDAMPTGLSTCFDPQHHHPPTRRSVAEGYRKIAALARKAFGACHVENSQDFMADSIDAISSTPIRTYTARKKADKAYYEYFHSKRVPFYQIVYHGLVQYHLYNISTADPAENEFLREIELGAMPRIEDINWENKGAHKAWLARWLPVMKQQYDILCKELGFLQWELIENHKEIAPRVYETTYADGTRILVNYTGKDYLYQKGTTVKAKWYLRIKKND